jgi:uncharacterized membrane protein
MMSTTTERVLGDYLERLERSMPDIPRKRREEIVSEIVDHIDSALNDLAVEPTEADVLNVLERVGDPEEIAADARERLDIRSPRRSATDPIALVLLLIGGFLWGVGWIAGVVLLWLSDVWTTRDKIIGTLVVPGGLAASLFLLFRVSSTEFCSTVSGPNGVISTTCEGGPSAWSVVLGWGLLALLILGPIATSIYLGRKLRAARG